MMIRVVRFLVDSFVCFIFIVYISSARLEIEPVHS